MNRGVNKGSSTGVRVSICLYKLRELNKSTKGLHSKDQKNNLLQH